MLNSLTTRWMSLPDYAQATAWILVITVALIILVALLTLWERKVIGWMQLRRGPNRVRIFGLLPGVGQPFADVFKLLMKEVIVPANSNKLLFRLAPIIALIPAFAAWAVIPLSPTTTQRGWTTWLTTPPWRARWRLPEFLRHRADGAECACRGTIQ